jgi:hypothetical protein
MIGGLPETGFLRDPSLHCKDLEKNPVSLMVREGPETGFLRDPSLRCEDLGKNPVSKDCGWVARNRVFARYFVTTHKFGKKPGFF